MIDDTPWDDVPDNGKRYDVIHLCTGEVVGKNLTNFDANYLAGNHPCNVNSETCRWLLEPTAEGD